MTLEEGIATFSPMERTIVRAAIEAVKPLGAVRWADETAEYLYVKIDGVRGKTWIRFIEGNGVDVISDYGVSLDDALAPVFRLVESLERGEYEITPKEGAS